ncbi:MAG: FUSC family membrane protein [Pseudomonadota bacterium]
MEMTNPAQAARRLRRQLLRLLWSLQSSNFTNGLAVGVGLAGIALAIYWLDGVASAAAAGVGTLITTLPDQPAPRHHKLQQMLPAPLLGAPLFLAVQLAHHNPLQQGLVLVFGCFVCFMGTAWGKRGGPVSVAMAFSMLFALAEPPPEGFLDALERTGWFLTGGGAYLVYGVAVGALLNRRYRTQMLAEVLLAFARTLRTQAQRFTAGNEKKAEALMADMLRQQAALADALQSVRDLVLESPRKPRRQKRAAMLLSLLEARDHLIACELDLDTLARRHADAAELPRMCQALMAFAEQTEELATDLLLGRVARGALELKAALGRLNPFHAPEETPARPDARMVRHVAERVAAIGDEIERMAALQRGDLAPDISAVREQFQLFISPTHWSWKPLGAQNGWSAPTLRHALRVSGAIGTGYLVSLYLPWATHGYWILVTISVVMRTNLAQTIERRNARVAGTLAGCGVVMAVLATHPEPAHILAAVALATAVAHAMALRRYWVAAVAATTAGLLQAHMLQANLHLGFAIAERLADTVIGATIAWLFSYVLPVWERRQIPGLVNRTLTAQQRHAKTALTPLDGHAPDVDWRLARREAYDSLSALVQATARTLSEPQAVRPPLEPLETLQALSYQMLAHLTAVKSMLQLRQPQLDMAVAGPALRQAAEEVVAALSTSAPVAPAEEATGAADPSQARPPDMLAPDLTPWLLERLQLTVAVARRMRDAAVRSRG